MKEKIPRICASLPGMLLIILALMFLTTRASAAQTPEHSSETGIPPAMVVDEDEAVAVADLWYAMELNRVQARLSAAELKDRFNRIQERQVFYLVSGNTLLDKPPSEEPTLAYIIQYKPAGYVIVSGSDRIEPILVFSADSEFRWDHPGQNFLRYFLGIDLPNRWGLLEENLAAGIDVGVHENWQQLRSYSGAPNNLQDVNFITAPDAILVEWDTAAWDQGTFYNDVVIINNGNIAGIPTGCTATAMAIKMRFHEWPGTGSLTHSYTDNSGAVQFSHSVNFGNQTYTWANMPVTDLTAANADVANLMYHAGVAVDMDYEVGGSGAWPTTTSMSSYFGYKGTTELTSGHDDPIKYSVLGGLPVIISSSTHTVVVDGYRDTQSPYYHINAGWGGSSDGWYNLNQIPGSDATIDRSYPYSSPNNYYYVDQGWTGFEFGFIQYPYNTLSEGLAATPTNGHLWLKAGSYTGAMTFTQAMTIHSYQGTATLGE